MSNNEGYNPFAQDTIEKMLSKKQEREKQFALLQHEVAEYQVILKKLLSTPEGKYFLKKLIKFSEIFSFDKEINPAKLVKDSGRKSVYLEMIRPYLDKKTIREVES